MLVKSQTGFIGSNSAAVGSRVANASLHVAVMKERNMEQLEGMQRLAVSLSVQCYDGRSAPFWLSHQ